MHTPVLNWLCDLLCIILGEVIVDACVDLLPHTCCCTWFLFEDIENTIQVEIKALLVKISAGPMILRTLWRTRRDGPSRP